MNKIKVPKGVQLAFVGDAHEHSEQFFKLIEKVNPSENIWFISAGDCISKGFGEKEFEKITDKLIELSEKGICFAVKGNHEAKEIKKNKKNLSKQLSWWKERPLSLIFEFYNGSRVTCVHAGVTPKMTFDDLESNSEVYYVRDVDSDGMIPLKWIKENGKDVLVKSRPGGTEWHNLYDGRFGYIVSGHAAIKEGIPKFYNYSCNLDTACYETGILTCQTFTADGKLGELIQVSGPAAKPVLNIKY